MLRVFKTEKELTTTIVSEMLRNLDENANPVFCLAAGKTPQNVYENFARKVEDEKMEKLKFVSLDEWVNISKNTVGSCYQMIEEDFFSKVNILDKNIIFFDGDAKDLNKECERIDEFLVQNPITFGLMGVGMNGHIGLNEPGLGIKNNSSIVPLSTTTKEVCQKYFSEETDVNFGITLGLEQIKNSKRVIVMIVGEHKAEIVKRIFSDEKGIPAQYLKNCDNIDFYIDEKAARLLN